MQAHRITRDELKKKIDAKEDITILDVRNDSDYSSSKIRLQGAKRIPLSELNVRAGEIDPKKEVVAYCT